MTRETSTPSDSPAPPAPSSPGAAIERLRVENADADAVLRLTGVYHNLLRQWAET